MDEEVIARTTSSRGSSSSGKDGQSSGRDPGSQIVAGGVQGAIVGDGQSSGGLAISGGTQDDLIDWDALARMLNLSPPSEPALHPLPHSAIQSQSSNFGPTPTNWYAPHIVPSPVPIMSIGRRFQPRSVMRPGAHRVQKMIFHTLRSYTLQITRDSFPPFIHYSSTSPKTGIPQKSLKPVHTCISLMKVRSGKVPGSAELFWRNVAMECEMWCEDVSWMTLAQSTEQEHS